ncbi:MAG: WYL domain-containing protein [Bacteroidetes bacterium]|nr:WYL domain-containing protein [Bacteroidota bacterium]
MKSMRPRGFDAPIECKDGFYFYDDPEYSIDNNPLNENDIRNIGEAIGILKQLKNIPVLSELQEMIIRLEGKIPNENEPERKLIDFEKNENLKGLSFIAPVYNAIKNEIILMVDYRPYLRDESLSMIIHPYLLKEYHNRWFLIGFNEEINKISHLALDRIESIEYAQRSFIKSEDYYEADYFQHVLGITIPEQAKPELIELRFAPDRAPYLKTKPIHSSQAILEENESGMIIRLNLIINKELISELLSYGKDVTALRPESLIKILKENLIQSSQNYVS